MLQNKPSINPAVRIPPPTPTYVPSPAAYPPYQLFHNDYEMRHRNASINSEPPMTPLIGSPSDSFGVSVEFMKSTIFYKYFAILIPYVTLG